MIEEAKKEKMYSEAKTRLKLMKVKPYDGFKLGENREIKKAVVDFDEMLVRETKATDTEMEMINKIEEEYDIICYYLIEDTGLWPDGCSFKRYTLVYVSEEEDEYEFEKDECIKRCKTTSAYVVNVDEPDCSEFAEFRFDNVGGILINAS